MFIRTLLFTLMTSSSLFAKAAAVLFDFGGVMTGEPNKELVVHFLCESLHLSLSEFEKVNLEKRKVVQKEGLNEFQFWLRYAAEKNIPLLDRWELEFKTVIKNAIRINEDMYHLVDELKSKKVLVALLSNIDLHLSKLLKELNLYEPFEFCLLSCEIGAEKPDVKAYRVALDVLKVPAHKIIFIDNQIENVEGAKKLGLDAILFQSASQIRQELAKRNLL